MFLAQAYEELAKDDLAQASEKGWGAAAQMVKAIAENRGWEHNSHYALHRGVDRLYRETSDPKLGSLFSGANLLHVNFYENGYSVDFVNDRLREVEEFVDMVEGLLGATT